MALRWQKNFIVNLNNIVYEGRNGEVCQQLLVRSLGMCGVKDFYYKWRYSDSSFENFLTFELVLHLLTGSIFCSRIFDAADN